MKNPFTGEITIPGVLISEKDSLGRIVQVDLWTYPKSIRPGLESSFQIPVQKISSTAKILDQVPINLRVNGQQRDLLLKPAKESALFQEKISFLPHCFLAQEIYLQ